MAFKLSGSNKRALAVEAQVDPRTVSKVYAGLTVQPLFRQRIEAAAKTLGLPAPPKEAAT